MKDNVKRKVINCLSVCRWKGFKKKIIGLEESQTNVIILLYDFMLYALPVIVEYRNEKLSFNNIDGFLQFEYIFIILRNMFFL